MKLTGQANHYWTRENFEESPNSATIDTWFAMKDKLMDKYVPLYYYNHLLDK